MTGAQNDVINAAIRAARVHRKCMAAKTREEVEPLVEKMNNALNELDSYVKILEDEETEIGANN